jgi:hypothetical protein
VLNFNIGDTYSFQGTPASGYSFVNFCGDEPACSLSTTSNPFTGTINASSGNVYANFSANGPTCPTGSNWNGAGQYCWDQPGMTATAANHLYNCPSAGAAAQDWGACAEGCQHMPAGQNDICYNGDCSAWSPYWVWACGWDSVGNGNPIINYDCQYGTKIGYQWCPNSCNWGSINDYCQ